jgi:hypothetical protein
MKIPGFTAEASLYKTGGCYHMTGDFAQVDVAIRPSIHCDPSCLDNCENSCPEPYECPPGMSHGACMRMVMACRKDCIRTCCK